MKTQKQVVFKRIDASTLRPKKVKPFNPERFVRLSRELKEAVEREEKLYGPMRDTHVAY